MALALGLDRLVGDPRWCPHPVEVMGWAITRLRDLAEGWAGERPWALRLGGGLITLLLVGASVMAGWLLERLALSQGCRELGLLVVLLALASALAGLEKAEQTLEQLRLKNFQTQLQAFKADVAKVASNKGQTLEQAAQQLKTKAEPVIAARRQLSAAVKCEEPAAAAPAAPAKP